MAIIQKTLFAENLDRYNTFVQDTDTNSKYFKVTELPDTFTGGKNAFLIQGSEYLVADTLIKIELKDTSGNTIYHEPGEGIISSSINGQEFISEYYEGVSKVVAVYIYPETSYGPCTLTILGELSEYDNNGLRVPVPLNWQGQYNVKWQKQINVNPSLANTTKIRFYQRPTAAITEILSPIFRIENGIKVNSGINQSFANIKLSKLETFAGDVKRVKVFRTSQGDISDFDLIQDILVESKELLTTTQLSGSVVGNTGIFTSETLKNFWNTGSLNTELTSSRIESGIKLNGSGYFTYTQSLDIKSANTYELNLDAFYSSSTSSNLGVYLSWVSQSYYGPLTMSSSIATLNGTTPSKNLLDTTIPFKIDKDFPTASLYFSQSQGEWHLGNISLKLSEDTAFSPDEVSFITTMPTVIGNEDFNFKFEFYDVNNNYVPVAVTQSANFTGGSNAITKLLTFESDRTAFRFSTGSFANPANQSVSFKTKKTNFTGSITYASSAFDVGGTYIQPASYAGTYPGAFVSQNDNGALLNISSFSGSVASVLVGSIVYTASCEGFTEFETIYRFEDGDNAPGVFVTANTNQFIYKATDLSLNPIGQIITIEAKRKNLASATTPLTVNSGSGKPPLTLVSTNATNGVDTYTIAGSSYPFSTSETIYFISGSDQFGNEFSDAIKITPVKILDGLSATLTNDNASLPALSNGFVASGSFILTSGSVTVKVGNESISFDDDNDSVRANNTFAITNLSGTGCTPNGGAGSNPSINGYGITNLTADSGSLDITISYKDGAGDTTSIVKTATYTKNKKAAPVLEFVIGNNNQSTDSTSIGTQITAFANSSLSVKEQYNGVTSTLTLANAPTINSSSAFTPITKTTTNLTYPTMTAGTDSVELSITGSVTDSEGVSRNVFGNVSLTKIKKAAPVLAISSTPKDQSVTAKSTGAQIDSFANATIVVSETYNGSTTTLPAILTATRVDTGGSLTVNNTTGIVTLTNQTLAVGVNSTTVNISAVVTDSEGTSRTLTDTLSLSKVKKAVPLVLISASPQAQSVLANTAGTQTGTLSNVTISALEGTTSRFTSMVIASTSGFSTLPIVSGATLTMTSAEMNAAEGSVTLTVTHTDSEGTSGQTQTIIVRTTKVPTGAAGDNGTNGTNGTNGAPGSTGADGKRTSTGQIYYQSVSTNTPTLPTATVYTFATNTFTTPTLTSQGWDIGAPVYTAGNTNKYWYSTFTAIETTAGGGTAVPTFSAAAQAINFTGLVTFTSANNISDGTNTSNIVTPGVVANHIGGANVTTIEGGKISTGVITSTGYTLPGGDTLASGTFTNAGTIFNLDNGSLRSKNFYIASNGDSVFKGTMQIGGTNLDATNTLNANTTAGNVGLGNVSNLTPQNQAQTGLIAGTTITGGGITLSGGGNIKGGQTAYNTGTGFFLGYEGSAYKFSIGNASTKGIIWDGNALSIGGDVTIGATLASTVVSNASTALSNAATAQTTATNAGTAASTAQTTATNAGTAAATAQTTADAKVAPSQVLSHIGGTNITTITGGKITTGQIKSGNHGGTADGSTYSSTGTSIDLDTGGISAKNFHINTAGDAFFKGDITGASGTFGGTLSGATITGGTIAIGSSNSIFKANATDGISLGHATWGSAPFRVSIGGALTASSVSITGGTITIGSNFSVDSAGNMVANNASMTGQVTATGGAIGGWTINSSQLIGSASAGRIILDPSTPSIKFNNAAGSTKLTIKTGQLTYLGGGNITITMPSQNNSNTNYTSNVDNTVIGTATSVYVPDAGNYVGVPTFSGNFNTLFDTSNDFNGYFSLYFSIIIKDGSNFNTANTIGYISVGSDSATGPNVTGALYIYSYNQSISFPAAGTYYFFPERAEFGSWSTGNVTTYSQGYTGNSVVFTPELDFGELTEYGLQVASSDNQYSKIQRGGSYAFESKGSIYVESPVNSFSYFNGRVHPYVGNTNELGATGNRWKTVWTNNALNSTSDERLKNSIEDTDLGLEFVNKLRPVKYKNNAATSPRYHYGLIAQEMIGTLNDFNKTTDDVGFIASSSLSYTEEDIEGWKKREDWSVWESEISASMRGELGLAYTELISPMIKAIQQLSAKVEELEARISGSI